MLSRTVSHVRRRSLRLLTAGNLLTRLVIYSLQVVPQVIGLASSVCSLVYVKIKIKCVASSPAKTFDFSADILPRSTSSDRVTVVCNENQPRSTAHTVYTGSDRDNCPYFTGYVYYSRNGSLRAFQFSSILHKSRLNTTEC